MPGHHPFLNQKNYGGSIKTIALIIAEKNFRDEEYQKPKEIFLKSNIKVLTASTTINKVEGKLGLSVTPDLLIKDINIDKLDGLFFIGGSGAEQYFNDEIALNLAKEAKKKGKLYGAICIAPVVLANAGLLKNKRATSFPSEIEILKEKGANFIDEDVVVDGKLITANGPAAAKKFGEKIVNMLQSNIVLEL